MFIVLSSWGHCESSLGSFDECRTAPSSRWPIRPSHVTWAVSPPVGRYRLQPPSPFIIITQPESWYSFTVPRREEGWVDLGTTGKVHTVRAQGCKSQCLCDKHNCPQRDSISGPRALQSRYANARPLRPAVTGDTGQHRTAVVDFADDEGPDECQQGLIW